MQTRFDLVRALGALILMLAFYSAGICSNWYGLGGPRKKKTPIHAFCLLIDDLQGQVEISEKLIDKCKKHAHH